MNKTVFREPLKMENYLIYPKYILSYLYLPIKKGGVTEQPQSPRILS